MGGQSELKRVILTFNPYSLMTCFAIFHIVRSDATKNSPSADGPCFNHQLLETFIDEAALAKDLYKHGISNVEKIIGTSQDSVYNTLDFLVEDIIDNLKSDAESKEEAERYPYLDVDESTDDKMESMFDDTVRQISPIVDKIQNEACRKHSRIFLQKLRRYKMWALQMYDSSAKMPSGVLNGNLNQLGDFDQCLSVNAKEGHSHITGKYCLALLDVVALDRTNGTETLEDAVEKAQAFGFIRSNVNDPGHFIPQFTSFNWAMCLPASCSSDDLQLALSESFNSLPGLEFNVRVQPEMCYVNEEKVVGLFTIVASSCFAFVVGVAIVATIRDRDYNVIKLPGGKLERIMMAFSLKRNWKVLVAKLPVEGDIHCIHGIRAIGSIMLYAAHKLIPISMTPLVNRGWLTELSNEPISILLRASLIYTDSFLMLSGVLTAYNMSKEMQRDGRIEWRKRYSARFIRLTPALAALVVFYAYVFEHLGSGPMWGRAVQQNADICKRGLWTNIFYIQNFFPFENMCATHTHQLALDMQLSLLSPILVYLLYKYKTVGVIIIIALHAASAIVRYYVTIENQLSLLIYHGITVSQLYETANLSYSLSTHRAAPYLVGVAVGFVLYKYQKFINIPKPAVIVGWLGACVCCYLSVFACTHVAQRDYPYDAVEAATYAAYSPITWSLALGWTICACALGHGDVVNKVLSWRGMVFLSRISYSMYLTQFAVFFYNVGTKRTSQEFQLSQAVPFQELLIVILVSIVATLLFDIPMQEVKGILTESGPKPTTNSGKIHQK